MKNTDMEAKVKQAFERATPDVLESVLSDCREQKGAVIIMKERKNNWIKKAGAIAAALALIVGLGTGFGLYRTNRAVAATVSLDVNPSVEISVNRKDRVLNVSANNADGETILGDMDLTGSDLEVAINAIVGSMLRNGYLNELANSVLVSVDSKDRAVGAALQQKLAQEISVILEADAFSGAVISQTVDTNDALEARADEYHISVGKANLIDRIIAQDSHYSFEDLAALSINELKLLSQSSAIKLENTSEVGAASEKEYIGRDAALRAALEQLQAEESHITREEIEMDFDDGVMVYEVEFTLDGVEHDFEIDAKTGNVLSSKKEQEDDAPPTVSTETAAVSADQAKQAAFDHANVNNAENVRCELDRDDGVTHYDIEFRAGEWEYDYEIDATSGKILKSEKERDDDAAPAINTDSEIITADEAKQAAFDHAGVKDAKNVKCELDRDDGVIRYEVEFTADNWEYDYEIDASTGAVLHSEKEKID